MPTCPKHPAVSLRCPACAGAKGGLSKSPRKLAAIKRNAKRPRRRARNR